MYIYISEKAFQPIAVVHFPAFILLWSDIGCCLL